MDCLIGAEASLATDCYTVLNRFGRPLILVEPEFLSFLASFHVVVEVVADEVRRVVATEFDLSEHLVSDLTDGSKCAGFDLINDFQQSGTDFVRGHCSFSDVLDLVV